MVKLTVAQKERLAYLRTSRRDNWIECGGNTADHKIYEKLRDLGFLRFFTAKELGWKPGVANCRDHAIQITEAGEQAIEGYVSERWPTR